MTESTQVCSRQPVDKFGLGDPVSLIALLRIGVNSAWVVAAAAAVGLALR